MTPAIQTEEPAINEVLTRVRGVSGDNSTTVVDGSAQAYLGPAAPLSGGPHPVEQRPIPTAEGPPRHSELQGELISKKTEDTVNLAFNTLAQTVLHHNSETLEDLIRAMLRPILQAWLDSNLPNIVERLVRAELERMSNTRPVVRPPPKSAQARTG